MKKYKLIKKYPGSPELGTIAKLEGSSVEVKEPGKRPYWCSSTCLNHEDEYTKYPEYWEEMKTYRILTLCKDTAEAAMNVQRDDKYSSCTDIDFMRKGDLFLEHLLAAGWQITAVERLSDNVIFEVGKLASYPDGSGKFLITGFEIESGLRVIHHNQCKVTNPLEHVQPYKKYFFTTEDDVDIYEGDEYYTVYIDGVERYTGENWSVSRAFKASGKKSHYVFDEVKYFSKKDAALAYITINKPCLSLREVLNVFDEYRYGDFKVAIELAASRHNS